MPQYIEPRKPDGTLSHRTSVDVSIIIVNWNSIDYLRECVVSICERTQDASFEVIVVDNASPAGDAERLEQQLPRKVKLIKSPTNLGFAGANNLGFRHSSGKYLLFLNPDTKLVSPAIDTMVQGIQALPDAGVLGCRLLYSDLSLQTSCIQTFPTILNQLLDSDWLCQRWPDSKLWGIGPLFSNSSEPAKVEVISGACMLVRRDVFEQVGLFSEDYFMYAEDLDLCYKVARSGHSNYYLGTATVIHYGGKSSNPGWATQMKWKSIPRFCEKNYGQFYAAMFRIAMASAAIGRLIAISVTGLFGSTFGSRQSRRVAFVKWKLILKTLVTLSNGSSPSSNSSETGLDCVVQP